MLLQVAVILTLSNGVRVYTLHLVNVTHPFAFSVVEHCGAMPDLEDKEGEVSLLVATSLSFFSFIGARLHCTKQH